MKSNSPSKCALTKNSAASSVKFNGVVKKRARFFVLLRKPTISKNDRFGKFIKLSHIASERTYGSAENSLSIISNYLMKFGAII